MKAESTSPRATDAVNSSNDNVHSITQGIISKLLEKYKPAVVFNPAEGKSYSQDQKKAA